MLNRTKDSGLGMTVPLPVCTTYVNSCCSRSTSEYWDKQYEKGNWKQVLESTALTAILVLTGLFAYGGFTLLLWCVRARKPNQTQTTHGWHSQTSPGTPARPPDPRILYGEILRPCIPVNKVIRTIMHKKAWGYSISEAIIIQSFGPNPGSRSSGHLTDVASSSSYELRTFDTSVQCYGVPAVSIAARSKRCAGAQLQ